MDDVINFLNSVYRDYENTKSANLGACACMCITECVCLDGFLAFAYGPLPSCTVSLVLVIHTSGSTLKTAQPLTVAIQPVKITIALKLSWKSTKYYLLDVKMQWQGVTNKHRNTHG